MDGNEENNLIDNGRNINGYSFLLKRFEKMHNMNTYICKYKFVYIYRYIYTQMCAAVCGRNIFHINVVNDRLY